MESDRRYPAAVAAASAVAVLTGVAWSEIPAEDLTTALADLERAQRLLDHARLEVAARLQAADLAALGTSGWASVKDFLTATSGGRKGSGGSLLRLAERLQDLPATRAAMAAGELSRPQAEAIARNLGHLPRAAGRLRADAETRLLALAADHDATDLDGLFRTVVAELDPDHQLLDTELSLPRQERAAHLQRYLAVTPDAYGGVRLRGYGTAEDAELITSTLIPLTAPVATAPGECGGIPATAAAAHQSPRTRRGTCPDPTCAHDGRDPRDHGTRLWDALVDACRRLQTTTQLPTSHAAAPRLMVTIGLDQLRAAQSGSGAGHMSEAPISAGAARRLACDAEIIPAVLGTHSEPLDLGRTHRLVTSALWHALVLRDQHCAFPGCTRLPLTCDAHHILHWADGGPTTIDNMILLCRRHHTLTHHSPWHVCIDPHSRKPVWTPPPRPDDGDRYTHIPTQAAVA